MSESARPYLVGIDHVVVVMLENRSFDTLLGWLYDGSAPSHIVPSGSTQPFVGLTEASPRVKGARTSREEGATYLDSPPTDPREELQYVTDQVYGPLKWEKIPPINP